MKKIVAALLGVLVFYCAVDVASAAPLISATPERVLQGEPLIITIESLNPPLTVEKLVFDGKPIDIFLYQSKPTAIIGIDLNKKPGVYIATTTLSNGEVLIKEITIVKREKYEAPLGIPEKLGGNSTTSQQKLISSLSNENYILNNLWTGKKAFWTQKFQLPVTNPVITDEYGYSRITGSYSIAHKGTDFRAKEGTPVMAMNRGVVRLARSFRTYGNTIVVDHGLGLMTMYMHLSKINVNEGQLVLPGKIIGRSGSTGYTHGAHLHLSVRVNNISIDPMKFLAFFGVGTTTPRI